MDRTQSRARVMSVYCRVADGDIDDPSDIAGTAHAVGRRETSSSWRAGRARLALEAWPPADDPVASPYVIDGSRRGRHDCADRCGQGDAPRRDTTRSNGAALVVDLSSLWGVPSRADCWRRPARRVVKVEGARRPDGRGAGAQSSTCERGQALHVIDFDDEDDISVLRA